VDLSVQLQAYYDVGRSYRKWWKFVFHFILNMYTADSFILCNATSGPLCVAHGNRELI